ncbi:MAG: recombinase family protein [Methyloceanibacter sp.]
MLKPKRPCGSRMNSDWVCGPKYLTTKRQFDMVMAWSVDRLGRSLKDLVSFLSELHALRIDLFLHQQGLDTRTPAGIKLSRKSSEMF